MSNQIKGKKTACVPNGCNEDQSVIIDSLGFSHRSDDGVKWLHSLFRCSLPTGSVCHLLANLQRSLNFQNLSLSTS